MRSYPACIYLAPKLPCVFDHFCGAGRPSLIFTSSLVSVFFLPKLVLSKNAGKNSLNFKSINIFQQPYKCCQLSSPVKLPVEVSSTARPGCSTYKSHPSASGRGHAPTQERRPGPTPLSMTALLLPGCPRCDSIVRMEYPKVHQRRM